MSRGGSFSVHSEAADLLVSVDELARLIDEDGCLVVDCRFNLRHPQSGRDSWLAAHVPGAVYAHLDENLAGRVTPHSGRHPLPNTRSFAAYLGRAGWYPGRRIVAYDAQGGAFAARLWWLMRYYGHYCVSLLDGGIGAWCAAQMPLESGDTRPARQPLPSLRSRPDQVLNAKAVEQGLHTDKIVLVDARSADRFQGRGETIDPVAGHVPGAHNRPYADNLDERGRFLPPSALRSRFGALAGGENARRVVHMCGSGVTACHNLFAMERAGLRESRLYAGSWSEWIRDPDRPVATGKA